MSSASVTPLTDRASDVALRDGSTVHVRPVVADDRDAIAALLSSLSPDSLYFRGCGHVNTDWLSDWAVDVDRVDRFGLVVTAGSSSAIVAHAGYVRIDARRAEIAFEVADSMHGHGIATLLLGQLAAVAADQGIGVFVASVMAANRKMLDVFSDSGFPVTAQVEDGVFEVSFPTALSAEVLAAFDRRLHAASIRGT